VLRHKRFSRSGARAQRRARSPAATPRAVGDCLVTLRRLGDRLHSFPAGPERRADGFFDLGVDAFPAQHFASLPRRSNPALTRWRILLRSNSANAPVIWKISLPMGVVVSMFC
jgi:hypothetical protein